MKAGGVSRIGESKRHTDQIVAFQVDDVSGQLFGNCKMTGNLAGKTRIWKSLQNCTGAKEMIAVAMGGVDRRQILSAGHNPIRQSTCLLERNRGVDQDSVALPRNKG